MKHLALAGSFLLFVCIGLALWLERPGPGVQELFGEEVALAAELPPLVLPGGTLSLRGRVRDVSGEGTADVFVTLLRSETDPSEAEPLYHAYTDAAGRFALEGLAPGSYRVVLTHPSAPPRSLALELPSEGLAEELEWRLAEPLPPLPVLPELERTRLTGRLRLPGSLAGEDAPSLAGFEVVLSPVEDTPLLAGACERRATTDAEGAFTLEALVAATYRAEVLPPWALGGTWPVIASASCLARADGTAPLDLPLVVGALEGELGESAARPLIGALVRLSRLDARDPTGEPQLWPPVLTDAAGRFRIELLPPGRYLLHLRAGSAANDLEVVIGAGQSTIVPRLELDPRAGESGPGG